MQVREEHGELSEQLKTDEAKAGDIEHSLRTKLDVLKQQIKNEGRTKIMYDVRKFHHGLLWLVII